MFFSVEIEYKMNSYFKFRNLNLSFPLSRIFKIKHEHCYRCYHEIKIIHTFENKMINNNLLAIEIARALKIFRYL